MKRKGRISLVLATPLLALFLAAAAVPLAAAPQILERLDAPPTYLVFGPSEELIPLPDGVELLGPSGHGNLVSGPPLKVQELAMRGFSLVRIDGARSVEGRSFSPPQLMKPPPAVRDPYVEEILEQMDPEQMAATIQRLQDFGTRMSTTDSCRAASRYLYDRFSALGLSVSYDTFPIFGDTLAYNVIAEKVGTVRPHEIYIICGHYDSMSNNAWIDAPGADDNASGTAAVLEAARVLSGVPFESTIRFIAFSGEEQGLIGSRHYVEEKVVPFGQMVLGVFNLDMIAYVHPSFPSWDANWYGDMASWDLGEFVEGCINTYTRCSLNLTIRVDPTYGSDHYFFATNGYPALFLIDAAVGRSRDWNPHYHSPEDRLETLDMEYAAEMARGAVAALAELAGMAHAVALVASAPAVSATPLGFQIGPNPFHDAVTFDLGADHFRVRVMDVSGRLVTELQGGERLTWSGEDAAGQKLGTGIYFYQIVGREESGRPGGGIGEEQNGRLRGRLVLVR
jgi:hypothetical protein